MTTRVRDGNGNRFSHLFSRCHRYLRIGSRRLLGYEAVIVYRHVGERSASSRPESVVEVDAPLFDHWRRCEPGFPWLDRKVCVDRFTNGHKLYALAVDGKPVCFGWVSNSRSFEIGELRGVCTLESAAFWIWDCITVSSHRNQG